MAGVIATGRSDYPNQINNVLVSRGVLRGALDTRASAITKEMELAAAHALARVIPSDQLSADYIVPSVFDRSIAGAIGVTTSVTAVVGSLSVGGHSEAGCPPFRALFVGWSQAAIATLSAFVSAARPNVS